MKTDNEIVPVEVFSGTIIQAQMVQILLENAGINAFLKDEINGSLTPWVISAGGTDAVKVVVANTDYDKAKLLLEQYQ